jgi:hypothetical protein
MSKEHSQGRQLPASGTLLLQRGPDTNTDSIKRVSLPGRRGKQVRHSGGVEKFRRSAGATPDFPLISGLTARPKRT